MWQDIHLPIFIFLQTASRECRQNLSKSCLVSSALICQAPPSAIYKAYYNVGEEIAVSKTLLLI